MPNIFFRAEMSTKFCLLCNLERKWPQNVEKIARFPGGETCSESCHVCGCHVFFGPETGLFGQGPESRKSVSCSRATQTCTGATLGLP